ncbi:cytidine deaminase [Acinetobacter phage SH-Ab 15599]|nr:cytidine deaminase [Acinetobacter phage SH-Ab 15599]
MKDGSPCEITLEQSKPDVEHAECHVISQCDDILHLHVTHSPCIECAKKIVEAGIPYVSYILDYRLPDGINYLRANGVQVNQMELHLNIFRPVILNEVL